MNMQTPQITSATRTRIWRGTNGGAFYPNPVRIDALLGKRIQARGFQGSRMRPNAIFASTDINQAANYHDKEDSAGPAQVTPLEGAYITWSCGIKDLILGLEAHIRDLYWHEKWIVGGKNRKALLTDTRGDLDTLETYLRENRQKSAITDMIESYLTTIEISEYRMKADGFHPIDLVTHVGEVWITGPYDVKKPTSQKKMRQSKA